jgi:hypothetical protein
MSSRFQAIIAVCATALALAAPAIAADKTPGFAYTPPKIAQSCFGDGLTMLARERGEYATHLATYAANQVVETRASKESLTRARRLLALAMQLSPRNRKALVTNFQLRKGVLPEKSEGTYTGGVLARLLIARAELLKRDGGAKNELLARCFIELAAEMDPRNEDAVYAYELQRIDKGELDWSRITDPAEKKASPAPAPKPTSEPKPPAR